jgi:hypothetical protein
MVPPLTSAGDADRDAPVSKWQIIGNFTRQIDCSSSLTRQQFDAHRWFGPIGNAQSFDDSFAVRILNGQCVFFDDARLRGGQDSGISSSASQP